MMADPHFLIEGIIITSYAIGCNHAFIYIRGEVVHVYRRLLHAVDEAYARGLPRQEHPRHRLRPRHTVHAGAGAYICGEETALLDSLEGARPAAAQAAVPGRRGPVRAPDRRQQRRDDRLGAVHHRSTAPTGSPAMGTEKSHRARHLLPVRPRNKPGQYEAPLGITLRELLDMAGGMRDGHELKFWTPGRLVDAAVHRRAPRRAARLRVGRRGRVDARHAGAPDLRRDGLRRARRRCAGPSSTRTSPAASARRAARGPTGSSRSSSASSTARAPRRTSRSCSTSATTSSAGRSARSATARRARSPLDPVLPRRVPRHLHGGCPFDPSVHAVRQAADAKEPRRHDTSRPTTTASAAATPSAPTPAPRPW